MVRRAAPRRFAPRVRDSPALTPPLADAPVRGRVEWRGDDTAAAQWFVSHGFAVSDRLGESAAQRVILGGLEIVLCGARAGRGEHVLELADAEPDATGVVVATDVVSSKIATGHPAHRNGVTGVLGIGWATVDLERSIEELPGLRFAPVDRDKLLGASRASAPLGPSLEGIDLVLLEPFTEGPVAATLARHGEGLAALYLAGSAFLGSSRLLPPITRWGPFLVLVPTP